MSAMLHDVDSVVSFVPDAGRWRVAFDVKWMRDVTYPVVGWATVVVQRSMWVIRTEVFPMVAYDATTSEPFRGMRLPPKEYRDNGRWYVIPEETETSGQRT